jgi:hypothetical protein
MSATFSERDSLAATTRLGVGATWAGALYWAFVAIALAAVGHTRATLALVLLVGVFVYPVGYVLNRAVKGDLFARRHPWGGLVRSTFAAEIAGWPIVAVMWFQAPQLVLFTLAASLGAHFIPFAWIYRFWPYAALGVWSVLWAAIVQLAMAPWVAIATPIGMSIGYTLAAVAAHRRIRAMRA